MTDSSINLVEILEDVLKTKRSIVITLPMTESWEEYQKELDAVSDYSKVMNFKVAQFPKGIGKGDRCYVTYKDYVRGWMEIVGMSEKEFTCSTTGKKWVGKFIERSGPFHELINKPKLKGFQGWRYFNLSDFE